MDQAKPVPPERLAAVPRNKEILEEYRKPY
jgi:hypothetical protein